MAKVEMIQITDDKTGKVLEEGDAITVQWSVNGDVFEFDGASTTADSFYKAIKPWLDVSRKVGRNGNQVSKSRKSTANQEAADKAARKERTDAIREWAKANDYEVADRGRIAKHIEDAFDEAMKVGAK